MFVPCVVAVGIQKTCLLGRKKDGRYGIASVWWIWLCLLVGWGSLLAVLIILGSDLMCVVSSFESSPFIEEVGGDERLEAEAEAEAGEWIFVLCHKRECSNAASTVERLVDPVR